MTAVLNSDHIRRLVAATPPLVSACPDFETQLQPSGVDLTLMAVSMFEGPGLVACDNRQRRISAIKEMNFTSAGRLHLPMGAYLVTYNEIVSLPLCLMALVFPRSSLLRSGVTVNTAVWDPGYTGRGQSLLNVMNPEGFAVEKDARIVQLVFFTLEDASEGYSGTYQGENIAGL